MQSSGCKWHKPNHLSPVMWTAWIQFRKAPRFLSPLLLAKPFSWIFKKTWCHGSTESHRQWTILIQIALVTTECCLVDAWWADVLGPASLSSIFLLTNLHLNMKCDSKLMRMHGKLHHPFQPRIQAGSTLPQLQTMRRTNNNCAVWEFVSSTSWAKYSLEYLFCVIFVCFFITLFSLQLSLIAPLMSTAVAS